MRSKSSKAPPTSRAHYVAHPGVRFNALNNPAKPSGRRHGLRSTVGFPRSIFLLFGGWLLMRRSGDAAADFLENRLAGKAAQTVKDALEKVHGQSGFP